MPTLEGTGLSDATEVDATTIPTWLRSLSLRHGSNPCVESEDRALTFAELDSASRALACGLLARGVGKGTRVGILFGNGSDWVVWWAAISRVGALCIPLSTFLRASELARVVRHSDLHLLIAQKSFLDRDFAQVIGDAFPPLSSSGPDLALVDAPFLRTVVLDEPGPDWARDVAWVVDAGRDGPWMELLQTAESEIHQDDETLCIYTSGQSAEPKGAVFSHRAILVKAHYFREMFGFTATTVTEVTLPLFWVGGLVMALFPTMAAGGVTRCTQRSTWGSNAIIGKPAPGAAASPMLPAGMKRVPSLGMTETFGMYGWGTEFPSEPYPIAAPLDELQPGFAMRIVNEHDADVADGEPGEILVRGPTLTIRLNKFARTNAFDDSGFYRTGDLAVRHEGRVRFVGRKGDMIKTSGANVSPPEVERELDALNGVEVSHVVGLPDADRGQLVAAAVVRGDDSAITEEEIKALLRQRLSPYKVPRVIVFLNSRDEVPMTPSTKVDKRGLAELIEARRQ
jgi:acyl-CoA synthetase (AMP-forming)/AMP-acid ligase II